MTLIGRQLRIPPPSTTDAPGPGLYNITFTDNPSMSYAPFSSCNPRFVKNANKKELGPGAYQIPTTIGNPSFIKFQNQRNIIIKINDFGSAAFRSKSNRFQQSLMDTPGVGNYEIEAKKVVKSRKRNVCKSADHPILKMIRENNHEENMKYEQKHPNIVSNVELKHPKSIGPGEYNWQQSNKKEGSSSFWSLSKVKRFSQDKKEDLEDSSIVVENIKREKEKQFAAAKPSSFFKSETVKSYFDQLTYETNSSVKLCIRKQLNYKSQSPAPGSYDVTTPKHEKNVFQFFGSTEERFKDELKSINELGPGEYIIPSGFKLKSTKHVIDQTKRTDFQQNNWMPGPGTYQLQTKFFKGRYHTSIEQFGSLEPRFKNQSHVTSSSKQSKNETKKNFNLNYQNQKEIRSQVLTKNKSRSLPHKRNISSFHSKSTYPLNLEEKNVVIPFGIYDIQTNDIGRVAEKDRNYLNQLQQSNLKRPPFNSGIDRFKPNNSQNCSSLDIPRLFDRPESVNKQSSAFRSETKRNFINKSHAPGVGNYQLEKSIVKDTFNRKYSNKPCGVKTKMAIIKNSLRAKTQK